jgi:REP element-mobilizing transposase RayT
MPGRNLIRQYQEDTYYHIYNRGVNKETIFQDDQDYRVWLNLFARYLSISAVKDKYNRSFPHFRPDVDLIAYCLMSNHFHLLVYVKSNPRAMSQLMHCITTSYGMYYNQRHSRHGYLFQKNFRARLIDSESDLLQISRYIHQNPGETYRQYQYSSYEYFIGRAPTPVWLAPERLGALFDASRHNYASFAATANSQYAEAELY